jgi:hypothetical protein
VIHFYLLSRLWDVSIIQVTAVYLPCRLSVACIMLVTHIDLLSRLPVHPIIRRPVNQKPDVWKVAAELGAWARSCRSAYGSNTNTRFQSFFMLMTVQPSCFASSYSAWVKVPTLVSGNPWAGGRS